MVDIIFAMNRFLLGCACALFPTMSAVAAPTSHKSRSVKPPRPRTSFTASPEAVAILDQSAAAYKNLKSLSLRFDSKWLVGSRKGDEKKGTFGFAREGNQTKARLAESKRLVISDGRWFYFGYIPEAEDRAKNKLQKWNHDVSPVGYWPVETMSAPGVGSDLFGRLLKGANPLREKISSYPVVETVGKRLPDTTIDGVKLQGVQIRIRAYQDHESAGDGREVQWTAWLDPSDHLLRRVQFSANDEISIDRFLDVKVNADFPTDYFKIPIALPTKKTPS
jgi:outer membrane lipoprotein-sorting protein